MRFRFVFAVAFSMSAACSPIPELVGVFAPSDAGGSDGGISMPLDHGFGRPGDMGPSGTAPCPMVMGATSSFCYWPQGPGALNLSTAIVLSTTDPNCALMAGKLSINAAAVTCAVEFNSSVSTSWGFSMTKPTYLAFSYSLRPNVDRGILTVVMPAGSTSEMIKVNGAAGNANVINLLTSAGTMFAPGISAVLAGSAKKSTLTFDWISVWQ